MVERVVDSVRLDLLALPEKLSMSLVLGRCTLQGTARRDS
jgi:hypothetical protein